MSSRFKFQPYLNSSVVLGVGLAWFGSSQTPHEQLIVVAARCEILLVRRPFQTAHLTRGNGCNSFIRIVIFLQNNAIAELSLWPISRFRVSLETRNRQDENPYLLSVTRESSLAVSGRSSHVSLDDHSECAIFNNCISEDSMTRDPY